MESDIQVTPKKQFFESNSASSSPIKHVSSSQSGRILLLKRFHASAQKSSSEKKPVSFEETSSNNSNLVFEVECNNTNIKTENDLDRTLEEGKQYQGSELFMDHPGMQTKHQGNVSHGCIHEDWEKIPTMFKSPEFQKLRNLKETQHLSHIASLESRIKEMNHDISEMEIHVRKMEQKHQRQVNDLETHVEELVEQLRQSENEKEILMMEKKALSLKHTQTQHNILSSIPCGLEEEYTRFEKEQTVIRESELQIDPQREMESKMLTEENEMMRKEIQVLTERVLHTQALEEELLFTQQRARELEDIVDQQESHIQELQNHIEELHQLHLETQLSNIAPSPSLNLEGSEKIVNQKGSTHESANKVETTLSTESQEHTITLGLERISHQDNQLQDVQDPNIISSDNQSLNQNDSNEFPELLKQSSSKLTTTSLTRKSSILLKRPPIRTFKTQSQKYSALITKYPPSLSPLSYSSPSSSSSYSYRRAALDLDSPLLFHATPNIFNQKTPTRFVTTPHQRRRTHSSSSSIPSSLSSSIEPKEIQEKDIDDTFYSRHWGVGNVLSNIFKVFVPDSS